MTLQIWHYRAIQVLSVGAGMLLFVAYGGWLFSRPIESFSSYGLPGVTPPTYARSFSINHGHAVYYRDGGPSEHPWKENLICAGLVSPVLPYLWAESRIRKLRKFPGSIIAEFRHGISQNALILAFLATLLLIFISLFNHDA
jgi:hypothetical protein